MPPRMNELWVAPMLLALAWSGARAQTVTYRDIFPDTLLPGRRYEVPATGFPGGPGFPMRTQDTVVLRNGAASFEALGLLATTGYRAYLFTVPLQARPGPYDAYSKGGVRRESQVTRVVDPADLDRTLIGLVKTRGLRGNLYAGQRLDGAGLPFGPLPSSGAFTPAVKEAALVLGAARIPLEVLQAIDPYALSVSFQVPATAPLGRYRLEVEREDGARSSKEEAFEVWEPAKPAIKAVRPESLVAGVDGILTLTGVNLEYGVQQVSSTILDREVVREIHIRKGNEVILPSSYPFLDWDWLRKGTIKAAFAGSQTIPLGLYDVAVVLNGRMDTAVLKSSLRVVGHGEPGIAGVAPDVATGKDYLADIHIQYFPGDLPDGSIRLRRGGMSVPGSLEHRWPQVYTARFDLGGMEPGIFDLEVEAGGRTMAARHAVLAAPEGYTALLPSSGPDRLLFFTLQADSAARIPVDFQGCGWSQYRLGAAPADMALRDGNLAWAPTAADTGWHPVKLDPQAPGTCAYPRFAMVRVVKPAGTGILRKGPPGLRSEKGSGPIDALGRPGARTGWRFLQGLPHRD